MFCRNLLFPRYQKGDLFLLAVVPSEDDAGFLRYRGSFPAFFPSDFLDIGSAGRLPGKSRRVPDKSLCCLQIVVTGPEYRFSGRKLQFRSGSNRLVAGDKATFLHDTSDRSFSGNLRSYNGESLWVDISGRVLFLINFPTNCLGSDSLENTPGKSLLPGECSCWGDDRLRKFLEFSENENLQWTSRNE